MGSKVYVCRRDAREAQIKIFVFPSFDHCEIATRFAAPPSSQSMKAARIMTDSPMTTLWREAALRSRPPAPGFTALAALGAPVKQQPKHLDGLVGKSFT